MSNSIVYIARCKNTGLEYIGCTKRGLIKRANLHAAEARRGKSGKFMEAIREYGINGFDWIVEREFRDHFEALLFEKLLVEQRNTRSCGYNTLPGGYRNGGRNRTAEEKKALGEKAREWQSRHGDYGSEISAKLKRFYETEEGAKQLATRKETANREDVREKMSKSHGGKPVEVLRDGVVVKTFLTQGECSRELGISQGNLNSCLLKRPGAKSLRGFTFRFAGEGEDIRTDASQHSISSMA